ncbi:MAG: hypothetical protein NVSMB42_12890 [Herpetosiphon sp.]
MVDTLNDMQQYLVDEFVEEYTEGHMSRRDALKRIAAISGSLLFAVSLLDACGQPAANATTTATAITAGATKAATTAATTGSAGAQTATSSSTAGQAVAAASADPAVSVAADDPALEAGLVRFPGQGASLVGYLARPKGGAAAPIVLVCHENRGLTAHIQDVTRRAAKAGYVALAVDLLARQGGSASIANQDDVPGLLGKIPPEQLIQDFQSGLTYAKSQSFARADRAGMVGFCYGGGVTWRVATKTPELRAAVPFYGPPPAAADVAGLQAAVLAFYGELDQRITGTIPEIEAAMKENKKVYEKVVYPGANHAFHNDTGRSYNAAAAKDAWTRTLAWFEKYLKA